MDAQNAAASLFLCRLCNLFSHSRSQLLDHCSRLHPEHETPDNVIVPLQPLETEPVEKLAEGPVKKKRGRPKGSLKKTNRDLPIKDKSQDRLSGLECENCHRSFSNRRQILKHICIKADDEEEDVSEESCIPEGTDSSQIKQDRRQRVTREKGMETKRVPWKNSKEDHQATGVKKTVINVVLTEDKSIPGVSKLIPIEDNSAEIQSASVIQHSADSQNASEEIPSEASVCEDNPQSDQCSSSNSTTRSGKGFQEYSVKQDSTNLPQSHLKIFSCEFCNKIFKFRHSLVAHLRTHTHEKPFQCPHCDYASSIKANLNVHLRKHTGEKFSCQQCPFSCLSPGHLKVHVERVHLKVKQHCSFCEKKYSDVKNLLKHMEIRHNLKDPAIQQSYQQLRLKTRQGLRQLLYHCSTCNRHFKNQMERERHLLVHGPKRPFACLLCDHAATKMTALAAHVMKHLFMYVCCICDDKFVSSQRLKSHLESHPGLDLDGAFTDSINCSFHLIQEEVGNEAVEDLETVTKQTDGVIPECRGDVEKDNVEGNLTVREKVNESEETEEQNGGDLQNAQAIRNETRINAEIETCTLGSKSTGRHKGATHVSSTPEGKHTLTNLEERAQEKINPVSQNSLASKNYGALSSVGDKNLSDLSPDSEKELDALLPSAFQQVFSSLQKTQLNIETFQRLRKIYGDLECQYCGKLFWYKVHYNVHVRTHTREYSHYCSKCNYSSITKSSLKRHQVQKHSGLLLPCSYPECKYTTPDKYKLQAHQRTQHEKTTSATCPVCRKCYPKHRLKNHIKSSHSGKEYPGQSPHNHM